MDGMVFGLSGLETLFIVCAFIGGIPLIILFIMQLLGFGADHHMLPADLHTDVGVDVDSFDVDSGSDVSFKILSVQSLMAFFLMFGLVGLALYKQSGFQPAESLLGGIAAGLASMWVVAKIFDLFIKLQSSGTLHTKEALGCEGEVYVRIPAGDVGRVMVNIHERLRELDAESADKLEIKSGERIKVIAVHGDTLVVEKAE